LPVASDTVGWISILPPLVAIGLALTLRQVLIALLCGVWLGATLLADGNALAGLLRTIDTYLVRALADPDHVSVVLFSLMIGGMVGIITRSGGTAGTVAKLTRFCRTPKSTQLTGWLMGVLVFFDDYANSLIVGPAMRPLCDRVRVSREKLSYIVDSTAAPVASLAVISTWIGFEIGLISDAFRSLGAEVNAYWIFVQTIPYRFYTIIALALVALVALMSRDVGPMWKAEVRARTTGKVIRDGAVPLADFSRLEQNEREPDIGPTYFAWAPILVFLLVALGGLYADGVNALGRSDVPLYKIIGAVSAFKTLLWGSFAGVTCAALLPLIKRKLKVQAVLDAFLSGVQAMNIAVIILILAWALGQVCKDMGTAQTVINWIEPILSPHLLPAAVFFTAAVISFATGTSWGTMAILMPIAIPAAQHMIGADLTAGQPLLSTAYQSTIAAVLTGSIFGDHCSPISDTTIMSSMCSGSDHVDHVNTQMPYAIFGAVAALIVGYIPTGWGVSPWLCIAAGLVLAWLWIRFVGKPVPAAAASLTDKKLA
jgi:Na+/H+ antiporter NhaC